LAVEAVPFFAAAVRYLPCQPRCLDLAKSNLVARRLPFRLMRSAPRRSRLGFALHPVDLTADFWPVSPAVPARAGRRKWIGPTG